MKKTLVLLFAFANTLIAQTNTKREKIKKLLLSGAGKVGIQVMNQMMTGKSTYSHANQQFWDDFKRK
jgi:hypothetical protein